VTPIYGATSACPDGGVEKWTGRDERARPVLVVHDPALTAKLPREVAVTSAWNAMAHAVEALWIRGLDRATRVTAGREFRGPAHEPAHERDRAPAIPWASRRVDFLDGLVALGGDGPTTGPGYRVNLYAANADMVDRAFSSADGDLLIVAQHGDIDVRTELGWLRAAPGTIIVIPRAIKFAVEVRDGGARGWMVEVFGPRLRLPERGPIGSNGLPDARHFLAPTASYEDRLCPNGFEIVHKIGGRLWSTTQEHSPFDVVAWHGVHVPCLYDLLLFNAMGSVTWDHVDPSIHTVRSGSDRLSGQRQTAPFGVACSLEVAT
jgi:homogentisate 1,2-dioxygenase